MSTYKYLDDNGLIYYHSKVKALLNNKVDKVSGKGLSTNDYTTTEKNKLSGIASGAEVNQNAFSNVKVGNTTIQADSKTDTLTLDGGTNITVTPDATNDTVTIATSAQVNVIETIKVNNTALTPSSKAVNITIPTNNNQLTNGAGYQTSSQVQTAINSAIAGITSIRFEIVQTLPSTRRNGRYLFSI